MMFILLLMLTWTADVSLADHSSAEDCGCESYRWLLGPLSLGTQLHAVGVEALHPAEGSSLSGGSLAEIQDFRRRLREAVPEHCRRRFAEHDGAADTRVVAHGTTGGVHGFEGLLAQRASRLRVAYGDYVSGVYAMRCQEQELARRGSPPSGQAELVNFLQAVEECRVALAHTGDPGAERTLDSHSAESPSATVLATLRFRDGDTPDARDLRVLQVFNRALMAGSEENVLLELSRSGRRMSVEDRLTLMQMFLGEMAENYDDSRLDGVITSGVVDGNRLLRTLRGNLRAGSRSVPRGSESPIEDAYLYAGVCRDIHSFGAKLGQALGFRDSLVVSYSTSSDSFHSVTMVRDPDDDHKVYVLNYGGLMARTARDSTALFQGPGDGALNYRLSLPDGRTIDTIPSAMGQFLLEASGFRARDAEPLSAAQPMLAAGEARIDGTDLRLRAGFGEDRVGALYLFAGGSGTWGLDSALPGQLGVTVATQQRPADDFGTARDQQIHLLHFALQQNALSPDLQLGETTRLRAEGRLMLQGYVGLRPTSGGDVAVPFDGNFHLQAGARLEDAAADGSSRTTVRAYAQGGLGAGDVRDSTAIAPVLHHVAVEAEWLSRIASTSAGPVYFIAAGTAVFDELGIRGEAEAGIASDAVAASVRLEGRLTDSLPVQDGSERRVGATLVISPIENVRVDLTGSMSLEQPGDFLGQGRLELRH